MTEKAPFSLQRVDLGHQLDAALLAAVCELRLKLRDTSPAAAAARRAVAPCAGCTVRLTEMFAGEPEVA